MAQRFSDRFDKLCDALFVERAAVDSQGPCRYVQSHGFYRNRWSAADLDDARSDRHAEANLEALVRNQSMLGPYERHVLGEILEAPTSLVMIVGYAGSGKSSTIHHVLSHYANNRHAVVADTSIRDALHRRVYYSLRPSHIVIDMQPICEAVDQRSEAEATVLLKKKWAETMPTEILRSLGRTMGKDESPRDVLVEVVGRTIAWSSGGSVSPEKFRYLEPGHKVYEFLDKPLRDIPSADGQYHALIRGLSKLDPETQIEFWHSVIDVMQLLLPPQEKLITVYDNADPMDSHLQIELQRLLHRISLRINHKIVAPVRPVAFKIRSFTGGYSWYPHSGPSPLDVISQRLICFLSHPHMFTQFNSLPSEGERRTVQARAFDILLRIHRGHGRHRSLGRVLTAMAGDSARRMVKLTRSVFQSDHLSDEYPLEIVSNQLDTIRRRYEYRAIIDRVGDALADEMTALADEVVIDKTASVHGLIDMSQRRLIGVVSSALRNASQIDNSCLCKPDTDLLSAILQESDGGGACRRSIERGWENVAAISRGRGFAQDQVEMFVSHVVNRLRAYCRDARATTAGEKVELVLVSFATDAISDSIARSTFGDPDIEDTMSEHVDIYETDEHCRQILRTNKAYAPAQALLRSRKLTENLFMIGERATALKLRIIYRLAHSDRGKMPVGAVTNELSNAGFSETDVLASINTMIAPYTRLLWADRGFEYTTYQELIGDPTREVVMSRSGWGYYYVLLSDIDYSLAMFSRDESQPLSLTRQLERMVTGLAQIGEQEAAIDTERCDHSNDHEWQRRTSTALDIAVRIANQFAYVVQRHARKVEDRRRPEEVKDIQEIVRLYLLLLRRRSDAIKDATNWDYCCDRTTDNVIFSRSLDPQQKLSARHFTARTASMAIASMERLSKALST